MTEQTQLTIQNTLEVLSFATEVRDTLLDGITPGDVLHAPALIRTGIAAYRGADRIPAELGDLDEAEQLQLAEQFEELFAPILEGIEQKSGLDLAHAGGH